MSNSSNDTTPEAEFKKTWLCCLMRMKVIRTEKKAVPFTPKRQQIQKNPTITASTPQEIRFTQNHWTRGPSHSVSFLRGVSSVWQEINSKRCNLIEIACTRRKKYGLGSKPLWEFISDAEYPHPVRSHGQELPDGDGLEEKWPLETSFSLISDKHLVESDKCLFLSTVSYHLFRKRFCLMKVRTCDPEAISTQQEPDSVPSQSS